MFLSLGFAFVLAVKDSFLPPEEQLKIAMQFEENKEFKKAERFYIMAFNAKDNLTAGQAGYHLGNFYLKGRDSIPVDRKKAVFFLEKADTFGEVRATYKLALLYDVGDEIKEDRQKAIAYMEKAVKADYPDALYAKAVWIERGYYPNADTADVLKLYEKSAEKGYPLAMMGLFSHYMKSDPEKAQYWFQKATALQENHKNSVDKNTNIK